jgi:hypothetical protein
MVDQAVKVLEIPREYAYSTPIPLLRTEIEARVLNIRNSRMRAEKYNEIDDYTKADYFGMRAVYTMMNAMFGGGKSKEQNKGPSNMSEMKYGKRN